MKYENPYRASGTFSGEAYISRGADEKLLREIHINRRYPCILASRQSGKSSLIVNTIKKLNCNQEILTIFIDLTEFTPDSIKAYSNFEKAFIEAVDDCFSASAKKIHPEPGLKAYLKNIISKHKDKRLIVFIDEIDKLLPYPYKNNFFGLIRSLYNRRAFDQSFNSLQFVLSGAAGPNELISNPNMSPFNIGEPIILDDFSKLQTAKLAKFLEKVAFVDEGIEDEIYRYTNGSVYLTHLMLEKIWDFAIDLAGNESENRIKIDKLMIKKVAKSIIKEAHNMTHFLNIYSRIVSDNDTFAAFKDIFENRPLDKENLIRLKIAGITNGAAPYHNYLYESIFCPSGPLDLLNALPDRVAELRRDKLLEELVDYIKRLQAISASQKDPALYEEIKSKFIDVSEIKHPSRKNYGYSDYMTQGITLHIAGNYDTAISFFNYAIELEPNNSKPWLAKGDSLYRLGDYKGAIEAYGQAIKRNPNDYEAWTYIGNPYARIGSYEDAIKALQRAIKINSNYPYAWYYLARCYATKNEFSSMIEALGKAVELNQICSDMANNDREFDFYRENTEFKKILKKHTN